MRFGWRRHFVFVPFVVRCDTSIKWLFYTFLQRHWPVKLARLHLTVQVRNFPGHWPIFFCGKSHGEMAVAALQSERWFAEIRHTSVVLPAEVVVLRFSSKRKCPTQRCINISKQHKPRPAPDSGYQLLPLWPFVIANDSRRHYPATAVSLYPCA